MSSTTTAARVVPDARPSLAWRRQQGASGAAVSCAKLNKPRRGGGGGGGGVGLAVRCVGGGEPVGAARAIDARLDAVVATLPIREVLYQCLDSLEVNTGLVLQAPPGAGKTTTLPLAMLLSDPEWMRGGGRIVLLEPRRLAARAAATRMAAILNEPVGETVGYRVRFDSKVSRRTRIEVVTEGVLVQRLQRDPSLEGVAAVGSGEGGRGRGASVYVYTVTRTTTTCKAAAFTRHSSFTSNNV